MQGEQWWHTTRPHSLRPGSTRLLSSTFASLESLHADTQSKKVDSQVGAGPTGTAPKQCLECKCRYHVQAQLESSAWEQLEQKRS